MKRGYTKKTHKHRSKDEMVFLALKRNMGDEVRSARIRAQNKEIWFRMIAYNPVRIASHLSSYRKGFLQSQHVRKLK
ncbi:MAG: hypothetical protein QXX17_07985 [Conexivisphaerales archaeon]